MKLLAVEIQGFRSFAAPQRLDFGAMPAGLYHVTGKNEAEPELGANGVGKSSLFDAIYWCVSGKTSRGLRAGTVKNWQKKERTGVITDWITGAGTVSVMRMWQPNALEVVTGNNPPRPVDQQELERLLGVSSPDVFLFCMYFAQFTPKFADLSAAEQSAVFSSVLGLGVWERAAESASEESRLLLSQLEDRKVEEARLAGQAQELLDSGVEEMERGWQKQQRGRIEVAEQCQTETAEQVKRLIAGSAKAKLSAVKFKSLREREQGLARLVDQFSITRRKLNGEVEKLQGKNYKTCPTCGAPVSNAHIKKELVQKERELKELVLVWEDALAKHHTAAQEMVKHRDSEIEYLRLERELSARKADLESAKRQLAERKADLNPYTEQREQEERRGVQLSAQIDAVQESVVKLTARIGANQYWVKGFKEIRLMLIQESLAQLTLECNEVLFQMGLQDWSVSFDVERENKSGTINKNFTVMVQAPTMKDPVPWEVWSGGESQRLRLAVSMGFANLVNNRLGVQPNVEMWDEPSTWMTEAGIQDLLVVLADRAQRFQRVILLADHRVLDFGGFAGVINIVKSRDGSQIDVGII